MRSAAGGAAGAAASRRPLALAALLALALHSGAADGSTGAAPGEAAAERWVRQLGEARELLHAGSWGEAARLSRGLHGELMADLKGGEDAIELVATALLQLAVAEAGEGLEDDALWHLGVADAFAPGLGGAPLGGEFGVAGERLDAWRSRARLRETGLPPATDTTIDGLEPPRVEQGNFIVLRASLEQLRLLDPDLRVSFAIDADGRVREPLLDGRLDNPAPLLMSLEVLREFRFAPARYHGRPLAVAWELPLPLTQGALRAGLWELKRARLEALLRDGDWRQAHEEASGLHRALERASGPAADSRRAIVAYYLSRARAGLAASTADAGATVSASEEPRNDPLENPPRP